MNSLIETIHRGGPSMWLLLVIAFAGATFTLVLALLSLPRLRVPAAIWWAPAALALMVGGLGGASGFRMVSQALQFASPEIRSTLAHAGLAEVIVPLWAGAGIAAALLTGAALFAGISQLIAPAPDRVTDATTAGAVAAISLLPLLGLAAISLTGNTTIPTLLCGVLLFFAIAGLAGASLYRDPDPARGAIWQRRHVAAAGAVLGAAICCAGALWVQAQSELHSAMAFVSAGERVALILAAREATTQALWTGGCLVLVALLAVGVAILPLLDGRVTMERGLGPTLDLAAGAGAGLLVAALGLLNGWLAQGALADTVDATAGALRAAVPDLPRAEKPDGTPGATSPLSPGVLVQRGEGWVTFQGEQPLSLPSTTPVQLAVPASTRATTLVETAWSDDGLDLSLVTAERQRPEALGDPLLESLSLGAVAFHWTPSPAPASPWGDTAVLVEQGAGVELRLPGHAPEALSDLPAATRRLAAAVEANPGGGRLELFLVPSETWTVQDLIHLCLASAGDGPPDCTLARSAEPPPSLDLLGDPLAAPGDPLTGDPLVLRALDPDVIQQVVRAGTPRIRACYEAALGAQPTLSGTVTVQFVIARDGSVSESSLKSTTLNDPQVEDCVVSEARRLRFPEPRGGGIIIVSMPFAFTPVLE